MRSSVVASGATSVPDGLIDNDTLTPAVVTRLLSASSNCTDTVGNAEPETTLDGIAVVIDNSDPSPGRC